MLELVVNTIAQHRMLPAGSRVMVAVSGGPDSMCLLYALLDLAPAKGFTVAGVAHVNHQLRGEESDADQEFVIHLAQELGLPAYTAVAPVSSHAGNLEQAASRARRAFFASLVREGYADRIALGHTRDDQAETVLFRILRGSGLSGLAGILPVTAENLIRPFLGITRHDIERYLIERGIKWRRDSSNIDPKFARNRIRHQLLPQLRREWNPALTEQLAQLADVAYEEERWWTGQVPIPQTEPDGSVIISCAKLLVLPKGIARRTLRAAIKAAKGDLRGIDFGHTERLLSLALGSQGDGRLQLPAVEVIRSHDLVRISPVQVASGQPPASLIPIPGAYPSPDGNSLIHLALSPLVPGENGCGTLGFELGVELCWETVPQRVALRGWRPGDRYQPLGSHREHKIKELFQKARVPSWQRQFWPILCVEDEIVWVRQFGVAARFAPQSELDTGSGRRLRVWETPFGPK